MGERSEDLTKDWVLSESGDNPSIGHLSFCLADGGTDRK